jgi:hypothetical protein
MPVLGGLENLCHLHINYILQIKAVCSPKSYLVDFIIFEASMTWKDVEFSRNFSIQNILLKIK